MENGKWKTVLTEMDGTGISVSITDGNENSVSVQFCQVMLAELHFCLFCLARAVNCTVSGTLHFV